MMLALVQAPSSPEWEALLLSIRVATACTLVNVVPGILCAWLLARGRFRGKSALDLFVHLPLVLPPVVTGYVLLRLLGPTSLIGGFLSESLGIDLAFDWKGAAIASASMGFPLMVRSARLAIELVDPRLESAARTLGAGRLRVFLRVTLPLALPGVLTGAVLCFARSLGEFGATMVFAANIEGQTRTLPLAIFTHFQLPEGGDAAFRLVGLSFLLAVGALLLSNRLARSLRPQGAGDDA